MLNEREMKYRISCAQDQGIPIANYGMVIAYIHGILKRSLSPFPEIEKTLIKVKNALLVAHRVNSNKNAL